MRWLVWIISFGLVAQLGTARADDAPWVAGVSAQHQAAAQKLLDAGNALFLERKFTEALERYKAAVAQWDHPAIRFNIVRCLIQLDRTVEASENLELALKYGAAPLEDAVYAEALAYQKLLANQIGDVQVSCTQTGVKIAFDGQPLLLCPGSAARRTTPGSHQLVSTRAGFLTKTTDLTVIGGKHIATDVALAPLEHAGRIVHRWSTWIPWVAFGGGLVVSALGGVLELDASSRFGTYNDDVAKLCPQGCRPDDMKTPLLAQEKRDAQRSNRIAVGTMAVGLAATVTGAVLVYLNRGRTVYADSAEPIVTPVTGGAVGGVAVRF